MRLNFASSIVLLDFVKINCEDFMDQGMFFADCKYVCKKLVDLGIDAIEISGASQSSRSGQGAARMIKSDQESCYKAYAAELADEVDVPIILVGGNRDFASLTEILNQTQVEYFALSRPLICESDLIDRWQSGDLKHAKYVSCNKCFGVGGTICIFNHQKDYEA